MKRITVNILMVAFLLMLTSCYDRNTISTDKKWLGTNIPEDEIILIDRYVNFAWGYADKGAFINSDGKVYSFDLSDNEGGYKSQETDAEFLKKLQKIKKNEVPCICLDTETIQHIYYYSDKINKDAEFNGKGEACDMGEHQLIICDTDTHELVLCRERGDYSGQLKDTNAKELISFFDESLKATLDTCLSKKSD